jgi:lipid-binding SYLF domain-containing protein
MRHTFRILPAVLVAGLVAAPVMLRASDTHASDYGYKSSQATKSAKKEAKTAAKLSDAEAVLKAAAESKDGGISRDLLEKAKCVGVFPSFKKVALGVGGEGGKGVFTCRTEHGMSGPAIYKIGGGSVGWQAGVKEADLILLVMDEEGMNKLLNDDHVEIGTDLTATAGPVGHDEKLTDTQSGAQLLAWSRTHGAFAGASLDGLGLRQDDDDNAELYHKTLGAREILTTDTDTLPVPQVAQSFVKTTEQYM